MYTKRAEQMATESRNPVTQSSTSFVRHVLLGYTQYTLPHHLLSLLMYAFTRWRWTPVKNGFTRWFVRRFRVDLDSAVDPDPTSYDCFNSFFTRPLKADARPLPNSESCLVSPADGVISQLGPIRAGQLLQLKGCEYDAYELLRCDADSARPFEEGRYVTVYLSPRDYHRVHLPCDAQLRSMTYVPGRLFSVNALTTELIPRLFARNDRLVMHFSTAWGPMALVMVGAIFVGSMTTVWRGQVTPPYGSRVDTEDYQARELLYRRGDEIGRFNMGSTVVLLVPPTAPGWLPDLEPGSAVRVRQAISS